MPNLFNPAETLRPIKDLWEASPTPISRRNTTCCGVVTYIGVRDPSHNEVLGKAQTRLLSFGRLAQTLDTCVPVGCIDNYGRERDEWKEK
jgi:hypothetical protein